MPATPEELVWHQRLLGNDPTVTAEISSKLLDPLVRHLKIQYRDVQDEHLLCDGAIEALMNYFKVPNGYDPEQRTLLGYLKMSAAGDLKNLLAKKSRQKEKETEILVELGALIGNSQSEAPDSDQPSLEEFQEIVRSLFPTSPDRELVELLLAGVRDTEPYARVLGLSEQPVEQQRNQVKGHKDRLKKAIERYFEKNPP